MKARVPKRGIFPGAAIPGTLTNGPTWTTGRVGQALSFDGTNDYVNAGDAASIWNTDMTMSFWIKPSVAVASGLMYKGTTYAVANQDYYLYWSGTTQVQFVSSNGTTQTYANFTNANLIVTGQWKYVVFVKTGTTGQFYSNGIYLGQITGLTSNVQDSAAPLIMGRDFITGINEFNGILDDVRIYNRALSAAEITNLYQSGSAKLNTSQNSKVTNGLVGLWSFNGPDMSGNTAYDRSTSGNNGTLTNGPVRAIGKVGQGLSFDGTDDYIGMPSAATTVIDNYTMAAWIYPANLNQLGMAVTNGLDDAVSAVYKGYAFGLGDGAGGAGGKLLAAS